MPWSCCLHWRWPTKAAFALDHAPDTAPAPLGSLQNGAKLFVNYCLNCHSASAMRYNRLQATSA